MRRPWESVVAQRLMEDDVDLVELAAAAAAGEIEAATPPDADGVRSIEDTSRHELPYFAHDLLDRLPEHTSWSGSAELEILLADAISDGERDALEGFLDDCLDHQGAIASLEVPGGFTSGGDYVHEVRAEGFAWFFDRSDNTGDEHRLRRAYSLGDDAGRRGALVKVAEELAGGGFEYHEDTEVRATARRVREATTGPWDDGGSWEWLLDTVRPDVVDVAGRLAATRSADVADVERVVESLVDGKYPESAIELRIAWDLWWDNEMMW